MNLSRISSMRLIPLSFLVAILFGAFLLTLPISSADGTWTNFVTALFTATTSVCVTGLTVVDTSSYWSTFGHVVILFLIQIGGFGIITVISMIMLLSRKKFSLSERKMLQDSLNLDTDSGILKVLVKIIKGTFSIELLGAVIYCFAFVPRFGPVGVWYSFFNSISAFCNAGIDILGSDSLMSYSSNPLVLFNTMALIILGGLGYVVWFDLASIVKRGVQKRFLPSQIFARFSEHTKLVLSFTFILIMVGWITIFFAEYNNPLTLKDMTLFDKLTNSLFESVTFRTAGFASFSQAGLSNTSCVAAYILMFIGGSPIGTAGGIKTVTFFLAMMGIITYIKSEDSNIIFNRKVSDESMRKASVIMYVSMFSVLVFTLMLDATNTVNLQDAFFEVISALATVGLTRDLTTTLNTAGRLIIIVCMYLGRIGPISMAIFFAGRSKPKNQRRYVEGKFFVG
ncbi:MAG: potassium transporter TrkH [Butyrivibrio sp.]|nr:potassium transporter TrkH [Butyrivibrio sp.]